MMNFKDHSYTTAEGTRRTVKRANIGVTLESEISPTKRDGLFVATVSFENSKGQKVKRSALVHAGMIEYSESDKEYSRPFVIGNEYNATVDIVPELPNNDPNKVAITLGCIEPGGSRATLDDFGFDEVNQSATENIKVDNA